MLELLPQKRATAAECLKQQWLYTAPVVESVAAAAAHHAEQQRARKLQEERQNPRGDDSGPEDESEGSGDQHKHETDGHPAPIENDSGYLSAETHAEPPCAAVSNPKLKNGVQGSK